LQIWYTREGQAHVGTSSIYTVGKFDGLVLVVDTHGGRVRRSTAWKDELTLLTVKCRVEAFEAS